MSVCSCQVYGTRVGWESGSVSVLRVWADQHGEERRRSLEAEGAVRCPKIITSCPRCSYVGDPRPAICDAAQSMGTGRPQAKWSCQRRCPQTPPGQPQVRPCVRWREGEDELFEGGRACLPGHRPSVSRHRQRQGVGNVY